MQNARDREISEYRSRPRGQREEADDDVQAIEERHEQYLRFQRYAFLMLTLMMFEARAKEFCKYVRDGKKQLSLSVDDLRGNFSEKLKSYLCRYARVLDEEWSLWQDLRDLQRVRNQIAHQGGTCNEEQANELRPSAQRLRGLRLESDAEGFRIELSSDTCRYAISTIASFFEEAGRKAGFSIGA